MSWPGRLNLHYTRDGERTIALDLSKPDEAQELYDYMTKCQLALAALQAQEERL